MSKKNIIDLAQYKKEKEKGKSKHSIPSDNESSSFEEKLLDFIHRPLNEPVSKNELLTIFEETQMDKDLEDDGDI